MRAPWPTLRRTFDLLAEWTHRLHALVGVLCRRFLMLTAERKARLGTDMARAWWAWQRPEQTAQALLAAHRASPAEVRDRPAIRSIVYELTERQPRTTGARELHAAVHQQAG